MPVSFYFSHWRCCLARLCRAHSLRFGSVFKIHFHFMVKTTHTHNHFIAFIGWATILFHLVFFHRHHQHRLTLLIPFPHWFVSAAFYNNTKCFFLSLSLCFNAERPKLCMHILIRVSPYKYTIHMPCHAWCAVLRCVYCVYLYRRSPFLLFHSVLTRNETWKYFLWNLMRWIFVLVEIFQ